ncbi:hypothetical protein COLO4_37699 [Corchorus olitorius]|uniref:Serine-threonine/tyrosine-protein kinase catalytic domain-containing protein n=1 Tax=Corchorus olitorius TaxID=93759 RepID=A0A1R3FZW9_9ROSI|nr:hypothetical protein COLO4_37699 [Corchorus olitorius]
MTRILFQHLLQEPWDALLLSIFQYGKTTEKTDVFSYGVVVLEVACGRRPIQREPNSQKMVNLVDWVWGLHSKGRITEAADKRLNGDFKEEEMRKIVACRFELCTP